MGCSINERAKNLIFGPAVKKVIREPSYLAPTLAIPLTGHFARPGRGDTNQLMELSTILAQLAPYQAQLVAVSKTHPPERIIPLYEQGQRDFGENKVQELTDKQPVMPADIRWHFIGHLQKNKAKHVARVAHVVHAVDDEALVHELGKRAKAAGRLTGATATGIDPPWMDEATRERSAV